MNDLLMAGKFSTTNKTKMWKTSHTILALFWRRLGKYYSLSALIRKRNETENKAPQPPGTPGGLVPVRG